MAQTEASTKRYHKEHRLQSEVHEVIESWEVISPVQKSNQQQQVYTSVSQPEAILPPRKHLDIFGWQSKGCDWHVVGRG